MGQNLSTLARPSIVLPTSYLSELGSDLEYDKSLSSSRFLKTIKARHRTGAHVIKVFLKPDSALSLRTLVRKLKSEKEELILIPNVLPYDRILETEKAGYLIRNWKNISLYDRISTRPFLKDIEKKWIVFQLLTACRDCREAKVSHGDIKSENILLTTSLHLYLADFAPFKPTYLPIDNPSDFSYFFDTSSRRACYIAPERFYATGSEVAKKKAELEMGKRDGKVTEAMDIFSTGCVIMELWREGRIGWTLSGLFKYKDGGDEGERERENMLKEVEDTDVREMVRLMTSRDPKERHSFSYYLRQYRGITFPDYFYTYLHNLSCLIKDITSPIFVAPPVTDITNTLPTPSTPNPTFTRMTPPEKEAVMCDSDERIDQMWLEFGEFARCLGVGKGDRHDAPPEQIEEDEDEDALFPVKLDIPSYPRNLLPKESQFIEEDDGAALLFLAMIEGNIRNCMRSTQVLKGIDMMLALLPWLSNSTKLDRVLPYIIGLLDSDASAVRAATLIGTTQLLAFCGSLPNANASILTEYVLPNLSACAGDPEVLVRATFAACFGTLCDVGTRFLDMKGALKRDVKGKDEEGYDALLAELQATFQEPIVQLLTDQSSAVKRALLLNMEKLCLFFGRGKSNDVLLSHIITYLNEREDWMLRAAFFESLVGVAKCVGGRSMEDYVLPLLAQALSDVEDFVVTRAIGALTELAELKLFQKAKIWELVGMLLGFLCHPNLWIREGATKFIATVADLLPETDVWCILYPALRRLLRADVKKLSYESILSTLQRPIPRIVFEAAVAWAGKSPKSDWWKGSKAQKKATITYAVATKTEDDRQLDKLRQLGMEPQDELKLMAMRDYINKLAAARQSLSREGTINGDPGNSFNFQDFGITPETIFFTAQGVQDGPLRSRLHSAESWPRRLAEAPRSPGSIDLSRNRGSFSEGPSALDDLRRRLARAGGSSTSLSATPTLSPLPDLMTPSNLSDRADSPSLTPKADLKVIVSAKSNEDPSDSTSTIKPEVAREVTERHKSRLTANGVDLGRGVPAVGSDLSNAIGTMDIEGRYASSTVDDDAMSGITTPGSMLLNRRQANKPLAMQRFVSTYEGSDPGVRHLLERIYLESYQEPLPEFGSFIKEGIPRRRAIRTSFPARERAPRRPEGTLIAHLSEHTDAINGISVSPDHLFFATCSDDGTVKVWDTTRLERNVTSRSRHTYNQGGKVVAVTILENTRCIASCSTNGTIWVHRVDVSLSGAMPKYGKSRLIRQHKIEDGDYATCLLHYNTDRASNLVYGTSSSLIQILDLRTMRIVQTLENPIHLGPITCMCIDKKHTWLLVGTIGGSLTLWDLRFGLRLRSWYVGDGKSHLIGRVHQISIHPTKGNGRWIIVSFESWPSKNKKASEGLEVWDIEHGHKVEVFQVLDSDSSQAKEDFAIEANVVQMDAAAAIENYLQQLNMRSSMPASSAYQATDEDESEEEQEALFSASRNRQIGPGIQKFLVGKDYAGRGSSSALAASLSTTNGRHTVTALETVSEEVSSSGGFVITGGQDRKVRFWDLGNIEHSAVVSGLEPEEERPSYNIRCSTPTVYTEIVSPKKTTTHPRPHRATMIAQNQNSILKGHQDVVSALAVVDLPFRCLISCSQDGVIKVFE